VDFFKNIIRFFSLGMDTPPSYGWFHLLFVGLLIIACIGAIVLANRHHNEKTLRIVLLVCGGIMILFEIYKQLIFTFRLDASNNLIVDYQWYAFPLQLCSTPMYVMIIAGLLKPSKIRDSLFGYLALFGLFGGLVVFAYPNDVFTPIIGINIQTMLHHGLQIVVGVFLLTYYRKSLNLQFWLGSFVTFSIFLLIALSLNYIVPSFVNETFNMFYISQKFGNHLPVLTNIYASVPYPVFLLTYALGFCFIASIFYWIGFGINKVCHVVHQNYLRTLKTNQ